MSGDTQGVVNIVMNFRSLAIMVGEFEDFQDMFTKDDLMSKYRVCNK